MTRNQTLVAKWSGDKEFESEVAKRVEVLKRGYPARHHGYRPSAQAISDWRYGIGLEVARALEAKAVSAALARNRAEAEAREAERQRILDLPENARFWALRKEERRLWRRLYKAHLAGERLEKTALDRLVEVATALLSAAEDREKAGLETSTWYAEWPSQWHEGYQIHYAKEHLASAKELRELHAQ